MCMPTLRSKEAHRPIDGCQYLYQAYLSYIDAMAYNSVSYHAGDYLPICYLWAAVTLSIFVRRSTSFF